MLRLKSHLTTGIITATAGLALSLTCGCAQGDGPDPDRWEPGWNSSVSFEAYMSGASGSRAKVADIAQLRRTGFGVFASRSGDEDFNPDASGSSTPDFMYNQKVEWSAAASGAPGEGTWRYEPEKKWPGSKVSFFAYAPHTATFGQTGITGITGSGIPGSPKLTFVTDSDVDNQIDLVYADATSTINIQNSESKVLFRFMHALSRINFRCAASEVIDGSTTVTVENVILRSQALGVSGNLNLYTGEWEDIRTADMEYILGEEDFKPGSNVLTKTKGTTEFDLTANGKYLMVMPSDSTVPVTLTVRFRTVTSDTGLAGGSSSIDNSISSTFDYSFEAGRAYCFTLHIGLKNIRISTDITEWDDYETGWTPVEPQ